MFWLCSRPKHWLVCVFRGYSFMCVFYSLYLNRPSSFHCRNTAAYVRYALLGKGRHHIALRDIVHKYKEWISQAGKLKRAITRNHCPHLNSARIILFSYNPAFFEVGTHSSSLAQLVDFQLLKLLIGWVRCSWGGKSPNCAHRPI